MAVELTQELAAALHASGERDLELVDPQTRRTYVLVDVETHQRAMHALDRQQSHAAIAEGLAQMHAGEGKALDEAFSGLRETLGFPTARRIGWTLYQPGVAAANERVSNCQVPCARPSINR